MYKILCAACRIALLQREIYARAGAGAGGDEREIL